MKQTMVRCDDCHAVFIPEQASKKLAPGIEWTFIMCPRCGARYTVTITDEGMRSDLIRIRQLGEAAGNNPKAFKQYQTLRERVKKRSTELRSKYDLRR